MRKILCFSCVMFLCIHQLLAVVARPKTSVYKQPNGYALESQLCGDEFFHYRVTMDKYVLLPNSEGNLAYAQKNEQGELIPSSFLAHNLASRTLEEKKFLQTIQPNLSFGKTVKAKIKTRASGSGTQLKPRRLKSTGNKTKSATTAKYLVILVNFSDNDFSIQTPNTRFTEQFNSDDYTTDGATGSVKQYFKDNSMSNFDPTFDVFGPVTLSNPMSYYGGNDEDDYDSHPDEMVFEACQLLDGEINFSDYDLDNDGTVDNVYVIYAGYGEAAGASEDTIWPHAWEVSNTTKLDGKTISSYSCSCELQGSTGILIDGIGTTCHEFSHSIGLPDMYDTDYEDNGQSIDVGIWSLMASGCYNNSSKTPPYYIGIEREILGWGTATELTSASNLTLNSIDNNQYYKITTKTPGEYYILENRQQKGWDSFLKHHGMLIYHIDLSDDYIDRWYNNELNAYSDHQCADIVEADGIAIDYDGSNYTAWVASLKGDLFPGTSNNTAFTDATTPSSIAWNNENVGKPVTEITESDGIISFKFMGGESIFGNFEALAATAINSYSFTANWTEATNVTNYLLNVYKKSSTETAATTINQGFNNFPSSSPTGFAVSVTSIYDTKNNYGIAAPSVKLANTNASISSIIFPSALKSLSFWIKGMGTDASSTLLVEGSTDQFTWSTIDEISNLPTTGTTKTYNLDVSKNYRAVRMTYTKSKGNLAVDDIIITYGQEIEKTYVLTDFPVTSGLSFNVTGLENNATYYYTLKAANDTENSAESNEIEVVLLSTDINQITTPGFQVYAVGSSLVINSSSKEILRIYNALGQLQINQDIPVGTTCIPVKQNQLYIVKLGSEVVKIMSK